MNMQEALLYDACWWAELIENPNMQTPTLKGDFGIATFHYRQAYGEGEDELGQRVPLNSDTREAMIWFNLLLAEVEKDRMALADKLMLAAETIFLSYGGTSESYPAGGVDAYRSRRLRNLREKFGMFYDAKGEYTYNSNFDIFMLLIREELLCTI